MAITLELIQAAVDYGCPGNIELARAIHNAYYRIEQLENETTKLNEKIDKLEIKKKGDAIQNHQITYHDVIEEMAKAVEEAIADYDISKQKYTKDDPTHDFIKTIRSAINSYRGQNG